jgi:hypothetical protein
MGDSAHKNTPAMRFIGSATPFLEARRPLGSHCLTLDGLQEVTQNHECREGQATRRQNPPTEPFGQHRTQGTEQRDQGECSNTGEPAGGALSLQTDQQT